MPRQLSFEEARPDSAIRIAEIAKDRIPVRLLLDGVCDQRNIGGLFRTADAARIAEIVLYNCPFDLKNRTFKKNARSTYQYVPYRVIEHQKELIAYSQQHNLVCVEYTNHSTPIAKTDLPTPITLVVGNEQRGVSQEVLDICLKAVHLPMLGIQSSLNVCTAGSIAIYDVLRRHC